MKQTFAIFSMLLGCSVAGQASAAEMTSLAYVNQASAGGFARMDTASIMAPIMQVARDLPRVDSGNSSHALVWQEGDFNTSSIEQSGGRNVGGGHPAVWIRSSADDFPARPQQHGNHQPALIQLMTKAKRRPF